jgi:hypothetical protein
MNRTRALTAAAVGALLAVAATSVASPWWTLHRLRAAVERHDGGAVAEQVDFPALRASVKEQMLASMKADLDKPGGANPFAEFGTKLAQALVDPLVDAVVSPAAVAAMVEHGRISIATYRYRGAQQPSQNMRQRRNAIAHGQNLAVDFPCMFHQRDFAALRIQRWSSLRTCC